MNGPKITNDERGFTVNKTGAMIALIVSLIPAVVIYTRVSNDFALLQASVAEIRAGQQLQVEDRERYRTGVDARLRSLETDRAGDRRDLAHALNLLTRIDARLERIERLQPSGPREP